MKVAYLLPGFVRDIDNLKKINKFIKINKDVDIHLYTYTYNILGYEFQEINNVAMYKKSPKTIKF